MQAKSQAELQLIPGLLRVWPCSHLVAPGMRILRTTELIGLLGRRDRGDYAIRPGELALRRLIDRPAPWRGHTEDPGFALHHNGACEICGWPDKRNSRRDSRFGQL